VILDVVHRVNSFKSVLGVKRSQTVSLACENEYLLQNLNDLRDLLRCDVNEKFESGIMTAVYSGVVISVPFESVSSLKKVEELSLRKIAQITQAMEKLEKQGEIKQNRPLVEFLNSDKELMERNLQAIKNIY
jgi:hypothetical protein